MRKKPQITILDSVHCKADKRARRLLLPILQYEATSWKRGKYGNKEMRSSISYLITGRKGTSGTFLTGLLPMVKKVLGDKINIVGKEEIIKPCQRPILKGIILRPDQRKTFRAIRLYPRGRIVNFTGSGKTIIGLGIMSMYSNCRRLFLVHTKTLLSQTRKSMIKRLGIDPFIIGGDSGKPNWKKIKKTKSPIVLAMIQSFSNIPVKTYINFFDVTIIDEEHHVNKKKSMYGKVMQNNLSPIRYGLTATKPTTKKELLLNEGLIGPTITTLTVQEGIKIGIAAKPKINLIPVKLDPKINEASKNKYSLFYQYGIVENRLRNMLIVNEVKKNIKNKETTLIIIERTDHGIILKNILKLKNIKAPFVYGDTENYVRDRVKDRLQDGIVKVVICSKIWREGINIPSLNNVVNACGMKEEKLVIQAAGRGLRSTKTKKTMTITDFLDPYRYLAEHAIARIAVYIDQGWM